MSVDLGVIGDLKRRARAMWASGDYDAVVDGIWAAGGAVTSLASVSRGDAVLDVACGTGNAAIQAALAGGEVTGVDLTPELFAAGRLRAEQAGVYVDFVEGDAEALPFEDSSFDAVLSTFGVMFAPRHAVAASEILRVLRPGGRIGLATWDPDGTVGEMFRAVGRHLPAPPPGAESPLSWGDPNHVREIFGSGIDLEFTPSVIPIAGEGEIEERVEDFIRVFPSLVTARSLLESEGRWEAARAEMVPSIEAMFRVPPTYLLIGGSKPTAA